MSLLFFFPYMVLALYNYERIGFHPSGQEVVLSFFFVTVRKYFIFSFYAIKLRFLAFMGEPNIQSKTNYNQLPRTITRT